MLPTFVTPGEITPRLLGPMTVAPCSLAKLRMTHVPYRGTGPLMTAIAGNEVQVAFSGPGSALPMVQSGRLRPLAVTTLKRSRELPDVPTLDELGFKGFEIRGWYGLLAPGGTPRPIVARLNTELNKAFQAPAVQKRFADIGMEALPGTPAQFLQLARAESKRWGAVIKAAGIRLD